VIEQIQLAINKIDQLSKTKPIKIISHLDTDGITSAAILSRALQRWNKTFSLEIVKNLEAKFIEKLPNNYILIFLDLASNSLEHLAKKKTEIFILDHHEVSGISSNFRVSEKSESDKISQHHELSNKNIPPNITLINPLLTNTDMLSSSGICYLFARTLSQKNKDLASLAIIGMVGDLLEKNINPTYNSIIQDAEATIRKGILIYPSTRPLDKALEYCSNPYIPGVTGSYQGVVTLLNEAGIKRNGNSKYKSLQELTEEEMSNLITAVMLRCAGQDRVEETIGNLFLVKWFNKLEDARELSASINACSRMDFPGIALGFCLGNKTAKQQAEKIYLEYKQHLVSALKHIESTEKISGNLYTIINAKDNIKDTIIGTVTSIISHSPAYKEGTIIIGLAYNEDKIKVSARLAGKQGQNLREVLHKIVVPLGGEVGGHPNAAGCLISKIHEQTFIDELKKTLEVEVVKV